MYFFFSLFLNETKSTLCLVMLGVLVRKQNIIYIIWYYAATSILIEFTKKKKKNLFTNVRSVCIILLFNLKKSRVCIPGGILFGQFSVVHLKPFISAKIKLIFAIPKIHCRNLQCPRLEYSKSMVLQVGLCRIII